MSRRFIAGAVCPRCGLLDKIVVDSRTDTRQCVSCGFEQKRPQEAPPAELNTRVTRPSARRWETRAEPVRLVTPAEGSEVTEPTPDLKPPDE